jgi:hypothetical protein
MLEVKKSALLGYAIMSFADLNDMGRGLQVELKKFNPRVATQAQINALKVAVGVDPNDPTKKPTCLNRFSPDHAMFMLVKPKYIDASSLRKDPFSSEFHQVRWASEARDPKTSDVAYLVNGNTRRELCVNLGADALSQLNAIKAKIENSKGISAQDFQKLTKERAEAATLVRFNTSWIVAFFDQGEQASWLGRRMDLLTKRMERLHRAELLPHRSPL